MKHKQSFMSENKWRLINTKDATHDLRLLKKDAKIQYQMKQDYMNDIAKVYEIDARGRFTMIVRTSFMRLPVQLTTTSHICYSCDAKIFSQINLHRYFDRIQEWKALKQKRRKLFQSQEKNIEHSVQRITSLITTSMQRTSIKRERERERETKMSSFSL
jgi:hypothetical protein